MSEAALFNTTDALRRRMEALVGDGQVAVGAPIDTPTTRLNLFLFHIVPNQDLRNEPYLQPGDGPALVEGNAIPLDLRYLITAYGAAGNGGQADDELLTLGRTAAMLQGEPTLRDAALGGQVVRLTLEPYPMEELSRIWGLFPGVAHQTSMVYLASPVYVSAGVIPAGRPVVQRSHRTGVLIDDERTR